MQGSVDNLSVWKPYAVALFCLASKKILTVLLDHMLCSCYARPALRRDCETCLYISEGRHVVELLLLESEQFCHDPNTRYIIVLVQ